MRNASATITISAPSKGNLGYLAGILDGEGYFVATPKTNAFGLSVSVTDGCIIDWLHKHFSGTVFRASPTAAGNQVYRWVLARQADLLYLLPLVRPYVVCKRPQVDALLTLVKHLQARPRYDRPTSRSGRAERRRRKKAFETWQAKGRKLRAAVRDARPLPAPSAAVARKYD